MKGTQEQKGEKYRVVVLGSLKKLNTEKEVIEEYVKYLSTIVSKRQVIFRSEEKEVR